LQREASKEGSGEASSEASVGTSIEDLDPREVDKDVKTVPIEDLKDLSIDRSSKVLKIIAKLQEPVQASLIAFLKSNLDIFAW
ncbi:hypothetical protein PanWU01x14_109020, partial [Parasponia andersonii]